MRFLEATIGSQGVGVVTPAGYEQLARAVLLFEAGQVRESLEACNIAGKHPDVRPLALIVARMCIRWELTGRGA